MLLASLAQDNLLMRIAKSDYGYAADKNFDQLKRIRDTAVVPSPLDFNLKEVLELTRWLEPDRDSKLGTSGHIIRAFACVVLLKAGADPANQSNLEGENSSIAQLIVSLDTLGVAYQEAAISLFAWRMENFCNVEDSPFLLLAILREVLKAWPDIEEDIVVEIADLLMVVEESAKQDKRIVLREDIKDRWLFRLTYFDTKEHIWRSFSDDLQLWGETAVNYEAKNRVQSIARLLAGC